VKLHEAPPNTIPEPSAEAHPTTLSPRGPDGFAWLIDGRLAGTPRPGLVRPVDYELALLRDLGISRLINLADRPFDPKLAASFGMRVYHEPIPDMYPPSMPQAASLCQKIDAWLRAGEVIAIHCHAGLGRTGTMLAAYWIHVQADCTSGEQALQHVRQRHAGWVQSVEQIEFLDHFAQVFKG